MMATRNFHFLLQAILFIFIHHISVTCTAINICHNDKTYNHFGLFHMNNSKDSDSSYFDLPTLSLWCHKTIQVLHLLMESVTMNEIIIIYSSSVSPLVYNIIMDTPKPLATYSIDTNSAKIDVEQNIFETLYKVNNQKRQLHFLLIGEEDFLTSALCAVNSADERFNQQGYFTFLHRWIMLIYEENLSELQKYLLNVQHLTAISVSHINDSMTIYSAMWKPWGRQFENIGMISNASENYILHWFDKNNLFPNEEYGFNGQLFRAASQLWPIYVTIEREYPDRTIYSGSFMEVLGVVSQDLNFTYEVKIAPDGHWGSKVNGTWNGIVGLLHNKEADISIAPLTTTPQRSTAMDFAEIPVVFDTHVAIYKTPPPLQNTLYLYFKPFRNNVWLTIGLSWIGYSVFISMVYITHTYWICNTKISVKLFLYHTTDVLWYSFASFFMQNIKLKQSNMSMSCLWGTWWLFGLLIAMVWSGNIISFITIKLYPDLITGLDFLTQQNKYKIITLSSTAFEESVLTANNSFLHQLGLMILEARKHEPELVAYSHDDFIQKVRGGGYVYIVDETTLKLEAYNSNCSLSIIPQSTYPFGYHFGLQNNSAYHKMFNDAAMKINDFGLYNYLARKYVKEVNEEECMNAVTSNPLSFYHIQSILLCFGAMLVMSIFVLGMENIISVIKERWYHK